MFLPEVSQNLLPVNYLLMCYYLSIGVSTFN
jgi:hypothetical protein